MDWHLNWARAYSDGHNNRGLRGGRLAHYANAYADHCEEVSGQPALASFFEDWDRDIYEGSPTEHWRRKQAV